MSVTVNLPNQSDLNLNYTYFGTEYFSNAVTAALNVREFSFMYIHIYSNTIWLPMQYTKMTTLFKTYLTKSVMHGNSI